MKKLALPVLVFAAMVMMLAPAPTTSALVLCEDCPTNPAPWMRCIGVCNGQTVQFCTTWIAWNCPLLFAPSETTAEELFLLTLEAQAVTETALWLIAPDRAE